jgi:hypothetical protein
MSYTMSRTIESSESSTLERPIISRQELQRGRIERVKSCDVMVILSEAERGAVVTQWVKLDDDVTDLLHIT